MCVFISHGGAQVSWLGYVGQKGQWGSTFSSWGLGGSSGPHPPGHGPLGDHVGYKVYTHYLSRTWTCLSLLMECVLILSWYNNTRACLLARQSSLPCPSWQSCLHSTCSDAAREESAKEPGTYALSGIPFGIPLFSARLSLTHRG